MLICHPYPYNTGRELTQLRRKYPRYYIKTYAREKLFMRLDRLPFRALTWQITSRGPAVEVVDYEDVTGRKLPDDFEGCDYLRERLLMSHEYLLIALKRHNLQLMYNYYTLERDLKAVVLHLLGQSSRTAITIPKPPKGMANAARARFGTEVSIRTESGTMRIDRYRKI